MLDIFTGCLVCDYCMTRTASFSRVLGLLEHPSFITSSC